MCATVCWTFQLEVGSFYRIHRVRDVRHTEAAYRHNSASETIYHRYLTDHYEPYVLLLDGGRCCHGNAQL